MSVGATKIRIMYESISAPLDREYPGESLFEIKNEAAIPEKEDRKSVV